MESYKSNSHRSKKQQELAEKKVEKVVTGKVKVKNKSEIKKFTDIFFAEDMDMVKEYIINDVIIPKAKDTILDIVNAILYGKGAKSSNDTMASKVSYNRYYNDGRPVERVKTSKSGYEYYDVTLDSRGEAEEVLYRMDEILETYKIVSVADFYELIGIKGKYTDNKYGWTDISSAVVVPVQGGYRIKLPKAMPLDL